MNVTLASIFAAILSSTYFAIGYLALLPVRMKLKYPLFLFSYLFFLYYWLAVYFGQWLTIALILGCSLMIYWGSHKNLLHLSFALTGHLFIILIDHAFTIPLSIMGISIPYLHQHYQIPVSLVRIFTAYITLRLLRRFFILPRLAILSTCPKKLLRFFLAELYAGLALMTVNFIYGDSVGYPTEVLSLNGLIITVFTLSTLLIFCNMYGILERNHELSLQQTQASIMQDYAHRMESLYEGIRSFRHDYRNTLATMQQYIDGKDTEALRDYFHGTILRDAAVLSDDDFTLGRLHRLEDDAVKSLLYTKTVAILNHKLNFELEIAEEVPVLPMDSLTLCRILGILLDNALEASLDSAEKMLRIAIVTTDTAVLFSVTNSTPPLSVPVSVLLSRGYSSKEDHEGIGLATAMRLLDSIPCAELSTKYGDTVFCQTLEVKRSVGITWENRNRKGT